MAKKPNLASVLDDLPEPIRSQQQEQPVRAASQVMAGSNQIVSEPRRLRASLQAGQFRVL